MIRKLNMIPSEMKNGVFTIQDYASAFLNGLGETQRLRFKQMLEAGIQCGMSIADSYQINYDDFITEVKRQLEVD